MSRVYHPTQILSTQAAAAIVANKFVGFAGVNLATAGAKAFGVADVDTRSGEMAPVVVSGTAVVLSGGALAVGDPVTSDASGRAVAITDAATQKLNGYVMPGESAAQAGELVEILLK